MCFKATMSLFICISLIFTCTYTYSVEYSKACLRVPINPEIVRKGLDVYSSRTELIESKFKLANGYSVTKKDGDFMYNEAIQEMGGILDMQHDPDFTERFIRELEKVKESGILLDDPEEAQERIEQAVSAGDREFSLGQDRYAKFLFDLIRRREALLAVNDRARFDNQGFVETMIVPDRQSGYLVTKAGIEGEWDINIATSYLHLINNGDIVDFLDSVTKVISRLREGKLKLSENINVEPKNLQFGSICVVDSMEQIRDYSTDGSIFYSVPNEPSYEILQIIPILDQQNPKKIVYTARIFVSIVCLSHWDSLLEQRSLRKLFAQGKAIPIRTTSSAPPSFANPITEPMQTTPAKKTSVFLIDLSHTLGPAVLQDALEKKGIPARIFYDFDKNPQGLLQANGERPRIIALSLTEDALRSIEVQKNIKFIRESMPEVFIIAGGPFTRTPKIGLASLKDINILIRGEGEEVLPRVLEIIGNSDARAGLNESQWNELKKIPGIFVRSGRRVIVSHLDFTNIARDFNTPIVKRGNNYYWNITRGCPYNCNFCSISMGRRYRVAKLEVMKRNIMLLFTMQTAFQDSLLAQLAPLLNSDLKTLRGCRELNYIPENILEIDRGSLIAILGLIDAECGPFDMNTKKEIAKILISQEISIQNWDDLSSPLPSEVSIEKAREAIFHLRQKWVERLLNEGKNLLEYGLFKEYLPEDAYKAMGLLKNISFPETINKALINIFGWYYRGWGSYNLEERRWDSEEKVKIWSISDIDPTNTLVPTHSLVEALEFLDKNLIVIDNSVIQEMRVVLEQRGKDTFIADNVLIDKTVLDLNALKEQLLRHGERLPGTNAFNILQTIKYCWIRRLCEKDDNLYHYVLGRLNTSEANTLVDKKHISEFLQWVIDTGINGYLKLDMSQNSVGDFLKNGRPDIKFIRLIHKANGDIGVLGTDGSTPAILSQNDKGYTFSQAMRVNAALKRESCYVENNNQITTPDSSLLDMAESFLMQELEPFLLRFGKTRSSKPVWFELGSRFTNENIAIFPWEYKVKEVNGNIVYYFRSSLHFLQPEVKNLEIECDRHPVTLGPGEFRLYSSKEMLLEKYPEIYKDVIQRWQQTSEKVEPEIWALGEIFRILQGREPQLPIVEICKKIKREMSDEEKYTFLEYLNHITSQPAPSIEIREAL